MRAMLGAGLLGFLVACGAANDPKTDPSTTSASSAASVAGAGGAGGGADAASNVASAGVGGDPSTGAGGAPGYTIKGTFPSWHAPLVKSSVFFAPYDDLEARVLGELGKATQSLKLAFFNTRLEKVKTLLAAKVKAGVDVQVLLDKKQQDESYNTMFEDLKAVGVPVSLVENTSAADASLHTKFTIIDGLRVLTGSPNYSYTALNVSDEALLVMENDEIAARFTEEFAELIAKGNAKSAPYGKDMVKAYMGPEDGLAAKLVTAIDAAKTSVVVAMFDMNTKALVDALIAADQRGVKVVVVLDKKQATDAAGTADEALEAAGVPLVLALNSGSNQAEMHSKYMVIDHQLTFVGSNNWTNLGSYYNDESLLIVDDTMLAARAEGNFAQLLKTYKADLKKLGFSDAMVDLTLMVSNVVLEPGLELRLTSNKGGPFENSIALDGNHILLKVPGGTRLDYSYEIVFGDTQLAVELGGKKLAHSFTMPFDASAQLVTDAFLQ